MLIINKCKKQIAPILAAFSLSIGAGCGNDLDNQSKPKNHNLNQHSITTRVNYNFIEKLNDLKSLDETIKFVYEEQSKRIKSNSPGFNNTEVNIITEKMNSLVFPFLKCRRIEFLSQPKDLSLKSINEILLPLNHLYLFGTFESPNGGKYIDVELFSLRYGDSFTFGPINIGGNPLVGPNSKFPIYEIRDQYLPHSVLGLDKLGNFTPQEIATTDLILIRPENIEKYSKQIGLPSNIIKEAAIYNELGHYFYSHLVPKSDEKIIMHITDPASGQKITFTPNQVDELFSCLFELKYSKIPIDIFIDSTMNADNEGYRLTQQLIANLIQQEILTGCLKSLIDLKNPEISAQEILSLLKSNPNEARVFRNNLVDELEELSAYLISELRQSLGIPLNQKS